MEKILAFFKPSSNTNRSQKKTRKNQQGQLVIEYVLLLSVVATLGMLMITLMVGRGGVGKEGTQGIIVTQWMAIVGAVSKDLPDE